MIQIRIDDEWNIITRTILPLVWTPSFQPDGWTVPFGTGAATFSACLQPKNRSVPAGSGAACVTSGRASWRGVPVSAYG